MSSNGGQIRFGIGFDVDESGLKKVQQELKTLKDTTPTSFLDSKGLEHTKENMNAARSELMKTQQVINQVGRAYEEAFNPKLNTVNIKKLSDSLNSIGLDKMYRSFSNLGEVGTKAFRNITTQALTTNLQLKQSSTLLDKMGETFANTIKWTVSSSAIRSITGEVQQAYGYVKALDSSLNDIRIVTGQSAEQMDIFAQKANKAAKALGTATTDYTDAALTFYQQGLNDQEVEARTDLTIKVQNVTGLNADDAAQYVTSVLNGYKVGSEEAEAAMDKLAAVGAHTASSLAELSEGMSKVASSANTMGVSEDQLAATLSTVISATRLDPSSVGTAFKTIYARISDIKAGSDEAEVSLGNYTKKMAELGFSVLDSEGKMRDLGEVMEEIGGSWENLTREQQVSLAQTMAGTRQYNNLMALFDNWTQYEYALGVSIESTGTLQQQQNTYMESTAAHLKKLDAAKEGVFDSLIDTESINKGVDGLTSLLNLLEKFIDSIGGMKGALLGIGTILTKSMAKPMAESFSKMLYNMNAVKNNAEQLKASINFSKMLLKSEGAADPVIEKFIEAKRVIDSYQETMSSADKEVAAGLLEQVKKAEELALAIEKDVEAENKFYEAMQKTEGIKTDAKKVTKGKLFATDENGNYKVSNKQDTVDKVYKKEIDNIDSIKTKTEELLILERTTGIIRKEDKKTLGQITNFLANQNAIITEINQASGETLIDTEKINELHEKANATDRRDNEEWKEYINYLQEALDIMKEFTQERQKNVNKRINEDSPDQIRGNINTNLNNFSKDMDMKRFSQGVTSAISSMTQLGFAASSVDQTIKTLSDDSLSSWEKTSQSLMSLSTAFTMGVPAIVGLITPLNNFIKTISAGDKIVKSLNKSQRTAAKVNDTMSKSEIYKTLASKSAKTALTDEERATLKAAGANQAFLATLGPIAIGLAAIAVAAGVTFLAYRKLTEEQRKAEEASETSKKMSENLKNIKTKAEEVKTAFNEYDEVKKSLEECTRGTEEWYAALENVNSTVLDILEKYPEFSKYVSRDENGALAIDANSQNEINKRLQEGVINARYASIVSSQSAKQADISARNNSLANEQIDPSHIINYLLNSTLLPLSIAKQSIDNITAVKDKDYSAIKPLIISAEWDLAKDIFVDRKLAKNVGEQVDTKLVRKTEDEAKEIVRELANQNKNWFTTKKDIEKYVNEYTGSLQKISEANYEYAKEVEATSKAMILETLGDSYENEDANAIAGALSKTMKDRTDALAKNIKEDYKEIKYSDEASNEKVAELWARYQVASGETRELRSYNAVKGGDKNRSFIMSDNESVTLEQMSRVIAAYEARNNVSSDAEKVVNVLENLPNTLPDSLSKGLQGYFSEDNFGSLNNDNLEGIVTSMDENALEYIRKKSYIPFKDSDSAKAFLGEEQYDELYKESFDKLWGDLSEKTGQSVEDLKVLFGEDLFERIKEGAEKAQKDFDDFQANMFKSSRTALQDLNFGEHSLSTQQQVGENLDKAYSKMGEEGVNKLQAIYKSLKSDEVEKFNDVINNIDWSNTSIEDLKESLRTEGVVTAIADENLQVLISTMENFAEKTVTELTDKFKNLTDILAKVDEVGDTITPEEYERLSPAAKTFFTMMADGMYALTGSAEAFRRIAEFDSTEDMQNEINHLVSGVATMQKGDIDTTKVTVSKDYSRGRYNGGIVDQVKFNNQLTFLRDIGKLTDEEVMKLQKDMESGNFSKMSEAAETLAKKFEGVDLSAEGMQQSIQDSIEKIVALKQAMAMSAGSLEELEALKNSGNITEEMYNTAFDTVTRTESEKYDLDYEEVIIQAQLLKEEMSELNEGYELSEQEARQLAIENQRMNKGFQDLKDNWSDWSKQLKSTDTMTFAKAVKSTTKAIADLVGASEDLELPASFFQEADNLDLITKAANGSEEAIDKLGLSVAKTSVEMMDFDPSIFKDMTEGIGSAQDQEAFYDGLVKSFENAKTTVINGINELQANLDQVGIGENAFDALGGDAWVNAINQMAEATGMGVAEMNAMLNTMGLQTDVTIKNVPVQQMVRGWNMEASGFDENTGMPTGYKITPGEETSVDSNIQVAQINTGDNKGNGPTITRVGNGGSPKGTGKKSGGGGGGGSSKQPDKMDYIDKVEDRYHDINVVLKQTENEMNKLQKAQEKLYGKELLDNLNKQLALLDQQKMALQEKLKLEKEEQKELSKSLGKQGVKFNKDGTIANYNDILAEKGNYVNSLIDKYNNMSAEEQEKYKETVEKAKEDFEKFQKDLDRYDTVITEEIPEIEAQIQEAIDKQVEINIKKFDMKVDVRLELQEAKKKWNEFKNYVIDGFKKDDILGNLKKTIEDFKTYFDDEDNSIFSKIGNANGLADNNTGTKGNAASAKMGVLSAQQENLKKAMKELSIIEKGGTSKIFGKDKAAALEAVQKYQEQVMESLTDIQEMMDSLDDMQVQQLQNLQAAADIVYEAYDRTQKKIEDNLALLEKLQDSKSYTKSKKTWLGQQMDINTEELASAQQKMKDAEDQMAIYANDKNSEMYKTALANYRTNADKVMELTTKGATYAAELYKASVDDVFNEIEKQMTDGKGFAYLDEEWELLEKDASTYLDTVNSTFEVQQLKSKYQKSIDESSSLETQKKLNDLMEDELAKLEKKDRLTQYDIDRANARYELALKQIALEEAQQNKSQMRLRRDSQGNYSYQYVSDEKAIADAQDELNKAQNDLYNLDKNEVKNSQNDIYNLTKEMYQKMSEVAQDFSISQEEREMRQVQIKEKYTKLIQDRQKDFNAARLNLDESFYDSMSLMYQTDTDTFTAMTNLEASEWNNMTASMLQNLQEELIPGYKTGITEMIDTFVGSEGFTEVTQNALNLCGGYWNDYQTNIQKTCEAAGVSLEDLVNGYDPLLTVEKEQIKTAEEQYSAEKTRTEEVQKLVTELKNLYNQNKDLIDQAKTYATKAEKVVEKEKEMAAAALSLEDAVNKIVAAINSASAAWTSYVNNTKNNKPDTSGGGDNGYSSPGSPSTPATTYYNAVDNRDGRPKTVHASFTSKEEAEKWVQERLISLKRANQGTNGLAISANDHQLHKGSGEPSSFDTGGYTGEWNKITQAGNGVYTGTWPNGSGIADYNDGKLAILHQKELVLNADDTKNMLEAVKLLRTNGTGSIGSAAIAVTEKLTQLQNAIDTRFMTIINYLQQGISQGVQASGVSLYSSGRSSSSGVTQNITIEASFPNANSADTIRQAFEQLAVMASQEANKR